MIPAPASIWLDTFDTWEETERTKGRSEATLAKRRQHFDVFLHAHRTTAPATLTAAALAEWFRAQGWTPGNAKNYRATLRGFFTFAQAAKLVDDNPALYLSQVRDAPCRPIGASGPLPQETPEPWQVPLRHYTRHLQAMGRSRETLGLREKHLRQFARASAPLSPYSVTFYDLVDYMAALEVGAETRRSIRASLRSFYAWATEAGHLEVDPATRLPVVRRGYSTARPAAENAIEFALMVADPRERLIIRLAAEVGLRRAEVAKVHTRDLVQDDGGWSLHVHGKGGKARLVPLPTGLAAELRNLPDGWVFRSAQTGGHISPAWVGTLMRRLLPRGVTMHQLRHRFATRAYEIDRDVFTVQQLLGHSSPETTRRYVSISADHLRHTVDALATRNTWTKASK